MAERKASSGGAVERDIPSKPAVAPLRGPRRLPAVWAKLPADAPRPLFTEDELHVPFGFTFAQACRWLAEGIDIFVQVARDPLHETADGTYARPFDSVVLEIRWREVMTLAGAANLQVPSELFDDPFGTRPPALDTRKGCERQLHEIIVSIWDIDGRQFANGRPERRPIARRTLESLEWAANQLEGLAVQADQHAPPGAPWRPTATPLGGTMFAFMDRRLPLETSSAVDAEGTPLKRPSRPAQVLSVRAKATAEAAIITERQEVVRLARVVGIREAARQLKIPKSTVGVWVKAEGGLQPRNPRRSAADADDE